MSEKEKQLWTVEVMRELSSSVQQGSMLGLLLFAIYKIYTSEVDAVIVSCAVQYHQYADNLMIYL